MTLPDGKKLVQYGMNQSLKKVTNPGVEERENLVELRRAKLHRHLNEERNQKRRKTAMILIQKSTERKNQK